MTTLLAETSYETVDEEALREAKKGEVNVTLFWKEGGKGKSQSLRVYPNMTLQKLNEICLQKTLFPVGELKMRKGDNELYRGSVDGKKTLSSAGIKEGDTIELYYPTPIDVNPPFVILFLIGITFFFAGLFISNMDIILIPIGAVFILAGMIVLLWDEESDCSCHSCCIGCLGACLT